MRLHRYVERSDFHYMEMDTDSGYMALSALLHLAVSPSMRRSFYNIYRDWFSRPCCEQHRKSFFKTQMAVYEGGDVWVPGECCTKQHKYWHGSTQLKDLSLLGSVVEKTSSKGLSEQTNKFTKEIYKFYWTTSCQ